MRKLWPTAGVVIGCVFAPVGHADQNTTVLSGDLRLRAERVEINDQEDGAEAVTVRLRPVLETDVAQGISVLIEGEFIVGLVPDRRNAFEFTGTSPPIPDPEGAELNRLLLYLQPDSRFSATLGRQTISLNDERFLGSADFRQNQQTYDAATFRYRDLDGGLTVEAGHIWQVNRFLGPRAADGIFDSDSWFFNVGVSTSLGVASLFHYDLDLDAGTSKPERSQTTGVRLEGRRFRKQSGVLWTVSAAQQQRQSGAAPLYGLVDVAWEQDRLTLSGRWEHLGEDKSQSFQTPLASLHRFQGAADVFAITPSTGVNDTQLRVEWRAGSLGELRNITLSAQSNEYRAADDRARLGGEIGAGLFVRAGENRLALETSNYQAETFGADTTKVWLSVTRHF